MDPKPSSLPAAPTRGTRQPTRARFAGLLLLVFMLIVWFAAPDLRLPRFFQLLVGAVNAILAMLVVIFAIREYGKKYNRLRWPLLGRVSTSKVAGAATLAAVFGWWLSPWAPIRAGESEPDLWRMLERQLDVAQLVLLDEKTPALAPPIPSPAMQSAANRIEPTDPPFRRALKAIVAGDSAEAIRLLDEVEKNHATEYDVLEMTRAQAEMYSGQFAAASRRFGRLLERQPRREEFLVHGSLAAALADDLETAGARAEQLYDQARARRHEGARFREAVNVFTAVRTLQGRLKDADATSRETKTLRDQLAANSLILQSEADPSAAANMNNATVLQLLRGTAPNNPAADGFLLARSLWSDCEGRDGSGSAAMNIAAVNQNLGIASIESARFLAAKTMLAAAADALQQAPGPNAKPLAAANQKALARVQQLQP
jgi:hypothetical protein